MNHCIILESRDPFERDSNFVRNMVERLLKEGTRVTVFLVQNGVLASRKESRSEYLSKLNAAGAPIVADGFSLDERAIHGDEIHSFIKRSDMDMLVDLLMEPDTRAIWH